MLSDEYIINRVLNGHSQDFRELMKRYQDQVYRLALRILNRREEAEDAIQETFLKVYNNLGSCRDKGMVWLWMRRIAVNVCLQKQTREVLLDNIEELIDSKCSTENLVEAAVLKQIDAEEILDVVSYLPQAYRTVIVLRYQEDLSYKEIAELLDEPVTRIQVRLHRAKEMLADRLAGMKNEV